MKTYLALILVACGPSSQPSDPASPAARPKTPDVACTTLAGMRVMNPVPDLWCERVQAVEDRALYAFKSLYSFDSRFSEAKARLSNYMIRLNTREKMGGMEGVTDCDNEVIYLTDVPPMQSTLGHELAHAVQHCTPTMPWDFDHGEQGWFHSNWYKPGAIGDALRNNGLKQ